MLSSDLALVMREILYMLLWDIIYFKLLFCNYATIVVSLVFDLLVFYIYMPWSDIRFHVLYYVY